VFGLYDILSLIFVRWGNLLDLHRALPPPLFSNYFFYAIRTPEPDVEALMYRIRTLDIFFFFLDRTSFCNLHRVEIVVATFPPSRMRNLSR